VIRWPRRRIGESGAIARLEQARAAEADYLMRQVIAERMRVHAAQFRVVSAIIRAGSTDDEMERLAWEAQVHLAAHDAEVAGARALAAAAKLKAL
jgi:hypothetical protein